MEFTHEGSTYRIDWVYDFACYRWRETTCYIDIVSQKDNLIVTSLVASGYSKPKGTDKFERKIGRKLSLTHALRNGQSSREFRKAAWAAYAKMIGGKW